MNSDLPADRQMFLDLLQPLERDLELYCRRLIWDPNTVQDALQNALLRALRSFSRYRQEASFRAWMFQILTREVFTLNRKHARRAQYEWQLAPEELDALESPPSANDPSSSELTLETVTPRLDDTLLNALRMLTENERAVLLLQSIGGFRYREIAEMLEMPLGSVMGFLSRARHKVRRRLASRSHQPEPQNEP